MIMQIVLWHVLELEHTLNTELKRILCRSIQSLYLMSLVSWVLKTFTSILHFLRLLKSVSSNHQSRFMNYWVFLNKLAINLTNVKLDKTKHSLVFSASKTGIIFMKVLNESEPIKRGIVICDRRICQEL